MKIALSLLIVALAVVGCAGSPALSPDQMVTALQDAGLEAVSPSAMTADDYGLAPFVGKGVHFLTPAVCPDCGGRAYTGTTDEISQLAEYYQSLGEASALFFSWVFVTPDGRGLVQLNGDMPETEALRYKAVVDGIGH